MPRTLGREDPVSRSLVLGLAASLVAVALCAVWWTRVERGSSADRAVEREDAPARAPEHEVELVPATPAAALETAHTTTAERQGETARESSGVESAISGRVEVASGIPAGDEVRVTAEV